jgi:hypothetical protein
MDEWISYTRNLTEEESNEKKINWNSRSPPVLIPCTLEMQLSSSTHYKPDS